MNNRKRTMQMLHLQLLVLLDSLPRFNSKTNPPHPSDFVIPSLPPWAFQQFYQSKCEKQEQKLKKEK